MSLATKLAGGLRLFCPYDDTKQIEVVAPSGGYTAGQIVLHEGVVGVPYEDAAEGEKVALIVEASDIEVTCVAVPAGTFLIGQKVYFDVADAEVNQSSYGNHYCGVVVGDAGVAPSTNAEKVRISLDGLAHKRADDISLSTVDFAAASIARCVFVAPFACELVRASANWGTKAGQAGTATLEKCNSAEAAGAGDVCLATAFDLAGTENTPQTSAAVADGKQVMVAGDRLHLKLASGAATSLANGVLTIEVKRT